MTVKAQPKQKIRVAHDVVYGSSYGLVQIPMNTVLTVEERLRTDDGVVTQETTTLKNRLGEATFPYTLWDSSYEVID